MRVELPKPKRCCFCLPLRYGIIGWGYIKLIGSLLLLVLSSINLHLLIHRKPQGHSGDFYIVSILCLCILLEIFMVTIMLIGAHRKNVKLLRIYLMYMVANFLLSAVLFVLHVVDLVASAWAYLPVAWLNVLEILSFGTFILLLNFYLMILVRSEIAKLRDKTQFQFVNNAADGECAMREQPRAAQH